MSSAYRSLHINTSRERMEYSDYPMPESYPDFPHHTQIAATSTPTSTTSASATGSVRDRGRARRARGTTAPGSVTLDDRRERRYDALLVANGHHWDPRWPEPAFPGRDGSPACRSTRTTTSTRRPIFRDKRVVVLGMGNSAMDIAVEASLRRREQVYLVARRGAHVIPKYVFGRPLDQLGSEAGVPFKVRQRVVAARWSTPRSATSAVRAARARPPLARGPPDHLRATSWPASATATIAPKPNIAALDGGRVRFADGTRGGRRHRRVLHRLQGQLPVLRPGGRLRARQRPAAVPARLPPRPRRPVLRRAVQPLGATMPIAEAQAGGSPTT